MKGTPCLGQEFETRVQSDGRELHQCTTCKRVSRTTRRHQQPARATASHDKTMGILWDSAQAPSEPEELDELTLLVDKSDPLALLLVNLDLLVNQWDAEETRLRGDRVENESWRDEADDDMAEVYSECAAKVRRLTSATRLALQKKCPKCGTSPVCTDETTCELMRDERRHKDPE